MSSGQEGWSRRPRRVMIRIVVELLATTILLLSLTFLIVMMISGPDMTLSDLSLYRPTLRWLTLAPEVALGAVGLIAGFIITISFSRTVDDADGFDDEEALQVYRGRVVLLEICATASLVIAVMVAFRSVTSDTLLEIRETFGLSTISIFSCMAASALAQFRSRHEQFERELALRTAESIEQASQQAAEAWTRGWPGMIADPSVKLWITGRRALGLLMVVTGLCTIAQIVGRVTPWGGLVAPTLAGVVLIALAQLLVLFLLPLLIVGYVVHTLRSSKWRAEKAFAVGLGIFALFVTTLPVLLVGITQLSSLGAILLCGVPLILLIAVLHGVVARGSLLAPKWMPGVIAQRAFQDIARRQEGIRRQREQRRADHLRMSA